MRRLFCCLAFLCLSSTVLGASAVRICHDIGEWPPYRYFPRLDGKPDTSKKPLGAMIDLMDEVFPFIKMEYTIEAMPWERCQREVEANSGGFEIAIEGTLNEARLEKYYATTGVYTTSGAAWYSRTKFPNSPGITGTADLKKHKLCGIHGYNYTGYDLTNEDVDRGPKDFQAAFNMLKSGNCDIVLNNIPTILGRERTGELVLDPQITNAPIPGIKRGTFHILISKASPRAFELLTKINQALLTLELRGVMDTIFVKHIAVCGRKC